MKISGEVSMTSLTFVLPVSDQSTFNNFISISTEGTVTLTDVNMKREEPAEGATNAPFSQPLIASQHKLSIVRGQWTGLSSSAKQAGLICAAANSQLTVDETAFTDCSMGTSPVIYIGVDESTSVTMGSTKAVTFTETKTPTANTIVFAVSNVNAPIVVEDLAFTTDRSIDADGTSDIVISSSSITGFITKERFPIFVKDDKLHEFTDATKRQLVDGKNKYIVYTEYAVDTNLYINPEGSEETDCGKKEKPCNSFDALTKSTLFGSLTVPTIVSLSSGQHFAEQHTIGLDKELNIEAGEDGTNKLVSHITDEDKPIFRVTAAISFTKVAFILTTETPLDSNLFAVSKTASLTLNDVHITPIAGEDGTVALLDLTSPVLHNEGKTTFTGGSWDSLSLTREYTGLIASQKAASLTIDGTSFTDCCQGNAPIVHSDLDTDSTIAVGKNTEVTVKDNKTPTADSFILIVDNEAATILMNSITFTNDRATASHTNDIVIICKTPSTFITVERFPVLKNKSDQFPTITDEPKRIIVNENANPVAFILPTTLTQLYVSADAPFTPYCGSSDYKCASLHALSHSTLASSTEKLTVSLAAATYTAEKYSVALRSHFVFTVNEGTEVTFNVADVHKSEPVYSIHSTVSFTTVKFALLSGDNLIKSNLFHLSSNSHLSLTSVKISPAPNQHNDVTAVEIPNSLIYSQSKHFSLTGCTIEQIHCTNQYTSLIEATHTSSHTELEGTTFTECSSTHGVLGVALFHSSNLILGKTDAVTFTDTAALRGPTIIINIRSAHNSATVSKVVFHRPAGETEATQPDILITSFDPAYYITADRFPLLLNEEGKLPTFTKPKDSFVITNAAGTVHLSTDYPFKQLFISPTGTDSENCGSETEPCKTISGVLASTLKDTAGAEISFATGTFPSEAKCISIDKGHTVLLQSEKADSIQVVSAVEGDCFFSVVVRSSLSVYDITFELTTDNQLAGNLFKVGEGSLYLKGVNVKPHQQTANDDTIYSAKQPLIELASHSDLAIRQGQWENVAASEDAKTLIKTESESDLSIDGTTFTSCAGKGTVITATMKTGTSFKIGETEKVTFTSNAELTASFIELNIDTEPTVTLNTISFQSKETPDKRTVPFLKIAATTAKLSDIIKATSFGVVLDLDGESMTNSEATGTDAEHQEPVGLITFLLDSLKKRYVSNNGADKEGCGTYDSPCFTLEYVSTKFGDKERIIGIKDSLEVKTAVEMKDSSYSFSGYRKETPSLVLSDKGAMISTAATTYSSIIVLLPKSLETSAIKATSTSLTLTSVTFKMQQDVREFDFSIIAASGGELTLSQVLMEPSAVVKCSAALIDLSENCKAKIEDSRFENITLTKQSLLHTVNTALTLKGDSFKTIFSESGNAAAINGEFNENNKFSAESTTFTGCSVANEENSQKAGALFFNLTAADSLVFGEGCTFTDCKLGADNRDLYVITPNVRNTAKTLKKIITSAEQKGLFFGEENGKVVDLAELLYPTHALYVDNTKDGTTCDSEENACKTISAALGKLESNETVIYVAAHTDYKLTEIQAKFTGGVEIRGSPKPEETVVDVSNDCFTFSDQFTEKQTVTIYSLKFSVSKGHLAMLDQTGTLYLHQVMISGVAETELEQPVIEIQQGSLTLVDILASDVALKSCAMIYVKEGDLTVQENCKFTNIKRSGTGSGSAICAALAESHTFSISKATFEQCHCDENGGAVHLHISIYQTTIFPEKESVTFTDCTAGKLGQALYAECTIRSAAISTTMWSNLIGEGTPYGKFTSTYKDDTNTWVFDLSRTFTAAYVDTSLEEDKENCWSGSNPCKSLSQLLDHIPSKVETICILGTTAAAETKTVTFKERTLNLTGAKTIDDRHPMVVSVASLEGDTQTTIFDVQASLTVTHLNFSINADEDLKNSMFHVTESAVLTLADINVYSFKDTPDHLLLKPLVEAASGTTTISKSIIKSFNLKDTPLLRFTTSSALTITNDVQFKDIIRSTGSGAVIESNTTGSVSVSTASFESCVARDGSGGAIQVTISAGASFDITASKFIKCSCTGGSGGAISTLMKGGTFMLGDAAAGNQKILFDSCSAHTSASVASNAEAKGYGGAIFLEITEKQENIKLTLSALSLNKNTAAAESGGHVIFVAATDSSILDNTTLWKEIVKSTPSGSDPIPEGSFFAATETDGKIDKPKDMKKFVEGGNSPKEPKPTNWTLVIILSVILSVVVVLICIILIIIACRRRRKQEQQGEIESIKKDDKLEAGLLADIQ